MSSILYKKEFICDCGCNYGSCGATNRFYLYQQNSCDLYTLIYEHHVDKDDYYIEKLITLTDDSLSALSNIINGNNGLETNITLQEHEKIKKLLFN